MFKKIMSVMLAIVMLMSVAMVAASAAQVEVADNSADAVADVAADGAADTGADAGAETASGNVLNFDTSGTGWNNFDGIGVHLWAYGGDSFYAWGAKGQKATDADGDGIWTYDLDAKGITLESGQLYACIFYSIIGGSPAMQTHNLLLDASVIGDTAYCKDPELKYENMEDSNKTSVAAFWQGQDETVYGPEKGITSIGNVVGTCVPYTTSAQAMFEHFLTETLENARTYSGKDDQTLLDDTAAALNLKQDNVKEAIEATGANVQWDASKSSLDSGKNESANETPSGGTAGGTGSTGSSGTTSTTKSGTASTTKTGQESTVLFIMLGVMIAAAGVVVLGRKERA